MKRLTVNVGLALALGLGMTLALLWLLGGASLPVARAADISDVNTTADNTTAGHGWCTLREAINNANANSDTTSDDCMGGSGEGYGDCEGVGGSLSEVLCESPRRRVSVGRDTAVTETPARGRLTSEYAGDRSVFRRILRSPYELGGGS